LGTEDTEFLRVVIPTGGRNLLFAGGEDSRFLAGLGRFGMAIV
jgi:hypothetical protein